MLKQLGTMRFIVERFTLFSTKIEFSPISFFEDNLVEKLIFTKLKEKFIMRLKYDLFQKNKGYNNLYELMIKIVI